MYDYNIFFHPLIPCCPIGLSAAWAVMSDDRLYAHVQFLLSQYILISLGMFLGIEQLVFISTLTLQEACAVFSEVASPS